MKGPGAFGLEWGEAEIDAGWQGIAALGFTDPPPAGFAAELRIGLAKAARQTAAVELGRTYAIEVTADGGERTVEVPDDLAAALRSDPVVAAAFDAMAYSHRKEYVRWVNEAKREQTRADRITKTVEMVREGRSR